MHPVHTFEEDGLYTWLHEVRRRAACGGAERARGARGGWAEGQWEGGQLVRWAEGWRDGQRGKGRVGSLSVGWRAGVMGRGRGEGGQLVRWAGGCRDGQRARLERLRGEGGWMRAPRALGRRLDAGPTSVGSSRARRALCPGAERRARGSARSHAARLTPRASRSHPAPAPAPRPRPRPRPPLTAARARQGSKGRLYALCGLTLAGALLLCMVQIWPIWMKIGLWWCSVTFLTTFSALCAVRLALFLVMFAVGFRGIWLFPNLFDDNQTFAGSFLPIMGKAEPVVVADECARGAAHAARDATRCARAAALTPRRSGPVAPPRVPPRPACRCAAADMIRMTTSCAASGPRRRAPSRPTRRTAQRMAARRTARRPPRRPSGGGRLWTTTRRGSLAL